MARRKFEPGDPVVFRVAKRSPHPGPRAVNIRPEPLGEDYNYQVDKFWVVRETRGSEVVVRTRRGKTHVLRADNEQLRHARWWERLLLKDRFPQLESETEKSLVA